MSKQDDRQHRPLTRIGVRRAPDGEQIEEVRIVAPSFRLDQISAKVQAYDWGQLPDAGGWSAGVGKADLQHLVQFWLKSYDWRRVERRLNQFPHFVTLVEREPIHFVHLAGNGSKPPVVLLHGWPGSFLEIEELVRPLATDGHDVVAPSLPGFAFSNPISGVIGPRRAGRLISALMKRLFGEWPFIVQGGDWGAALGGWMAHDCPTDLLGLHLNMLNVVTADVGPTTPDEEDWQKRFKLNIDRETPYAREQETRPQTLGASLADSPVGAAAWILEKFGVWADLAKRSDGSPDIWSRFTEETILTDIMLHLVPSSMVTATWIYRGDRLESSRTFPAGTRILVPTGVAAFPDPVFLPPPRSFAARSYNIVRWTEMPHGDHFAALEQPLALLADFRAFIGLVANRG